MPKHHHHSETQTSFFRRHNSLKIVIDYIFKKAEIIIVAAIMAGIGGCNHWKESKDTQTIWQHSADWAHKSDVTNAVEQLKEAP